MTISPHHYRQHSHAVELVRVRDLINRISAEVCAWSSAAGSTSSDVARFAAAARELAVKGNAAIAGINSVPNSIVLLTRPDCSGNIAAMNAALRQIAAVGRQQGGGDMIATDDGSCLTESPSIESSNQPLISPRALPPPTPGD